MLPDSNTYLDQKEEPGHKRLRTQLGGQAHHDPKNESGSVKRDVCRRDPCSDLVCAKNHTNACGGAEGRWERVTCDDGWVCPAARAVPTHAVGGGRVGRWCTVVGVGGGRRIGQSTKVDVNVG